MFRFVVRFLSSQSQRIEALQMYKIIICMQDLVLKNEVSFLNCYFCKLNLYRVCHYHEFINT